MQLHIRHTLIYPQAGVSKQLLMCDGFFDRRHKSHSIERGYLNLTTKPRQPTRTYLCTRPGRNGETHAGRWGSGDDGLMGLWECTHIATMAGQQGSRLYTTTSSRAVPLFSWIDAAATVSLLPAEGGNVLAMALHYIGAFQFLSDIRRCLG